MINPQTFLPNFVKHTLWIGLGTVLMFSAAGKPAQAQSAGDLAPSNSSYQNNEINSGSNSTFGNLNPFSLIHQANLHGRDPQEFNTEMQSSLDDEAAAYRNRLRQLWIQRQPQETPAVTTETGLTPDPRVTTPTPQSN